MPKPDDDSPLPAPAPVTPPTLPPDFPDIPQNPGSKLQPPPPPSASPDKVAGTAGFAGRWGAVGRCRPLAGRLSGASGPFLSSLRVGIPTRHSAHYTHRRLTQ
jgi:hypothetical protein